MSEKILSNNSCISLGSIDGEADLKPRPGVININPPPQGGRCDCCGKHIRELKPFGGPGDPLDDDFTESLLVKTYRPMGPYVEEAEKAVREAEKCYKSDGFDNDLAWMVDKYGEEKADELDAAEWYNCAVFSHWECRDCVVLDMDEYFKKLEQKLEQLGCPEQIYWKRGWHEFENLVLEYNI